MRFCKDSRHSSMRRKGWMKYVVRWFHFVWMSSDWLTIFILQMRMTFWLWFKHTWVIYFGLWESFHSKNKTLKHRTHISKACAAMTSKISKHNVQLNHFRAIYHLLPGSCPTVSKSIFTVFRDNNNHIIHRSHVQSISTESKWNFSK